MILSENLLRPTVYLLLDVPLIPCIMYPTIADIISYSITELIKFSSIILWVLNYIQLNYNLISSSDFLKCGRSQHGT